MTDIAFGMIVCGIVESRCFYDMRAILEVKLHRTNWYCCAAHFWEPFLVLLPEDVFRWLGKGSLARPLH